MTVSVRNRRLLPAFLTSLEIPYTTLGTGSSSMLVFEYDKDIFSLYERFTDEFKYKECLKQEVRENFTLGFLTVQELRLQLEKIDSMQIERRY